MVSICHEVWIDAPADVVYQLLATPQGMSRWWDQQTQIETEAGEVWEHNPGPEHGPVRMLILERDENRLFKWKCISTHPNGGPASAWTGTVMTFRLGDRSSSAIASEKWAQAFPLQTVLTFTHEGWASDSIYLPFCNTAWAGVLQSLADKAVESSAGQSA